MTSSPTISPRSSRREYEQAIAATQRQERLIEQALAKARAQAAVANDEQRAKLEDRIAQLNGQLAEDEAKNQRALSMAQQTKKGTIYVISTLAHSAMTFSRSA